MLPYVFDIIILLILAFFAWRGAKKGLILTLFGLAGLFVAFFGARFLSGAFYEPVSDIIQPGIYQSILGAEEKVLGAAHMEHVASVDDLLQIIRDTGLFPGLTGLLDSAAQSGGIQAAGQSAAEALSGYLADVAAKAGLFILSFLVIQLLWFLVGHVLDLAFQLPGLNALNLAGGLILGLVKAVLLVLILVWVCQLAGWVPAEPTTPVLALFTPKSMAELLNRLLT